MINCEHCEWRGFVSELGEHEYTEHGIGTWGGPDCTHCGGNGEVLSRVPDWSGNELWNLCPKCKGRGFIA